MSAIDCVCAGFCTFANTSHVPLLLDLPGLAHRIYVRMNYGIKAAGVPVYKLCGCKTKRMKI